MPPPTAKPFLRWAGSKRKLIPMLETHFQRPFERYVEPFMGSACLFFALQPHRAILSDINGHLIETYHQITSDYERVWERLLSLPKDKDSYYRIRAEDTESLLPHERAARFIYLNRLCFNGLYRTNARGHFNVPYGANRAGRFPTIDELAAVALSLKDAEILHADFRTILSGLGPGDIAYIDPPYAVSNRRIFRQYGPAVFGLSDLGDLFSILDTIDENGAKFILSYADSDEIKPMLSKWKSKGVKTLRNIAGFATHRRLDSEVVLSN